MLITVKDRTNRETLKYRINEAFRLTRFNIGEIELLGKSQLKLRNIRLKEKKLYCGNHPDSCELNVFGSPPRRGNWLEGTDWVDFNDCLNDVLDGLDVRARVRSSVCEIRRGYERRLAYSSTLFNGFSPVTVWNKYGNEGDYKDCCLTTAPSSEYPLGTPGLYEREPNWFIDYLEGITVK